MKKTIAILLVAVLAMCSVFAEIALGGNAKVEFIGDFDNKTAKFVNTPDVELSLDANSAEKESVSSTESGSRSLSEVSWVIVAFLLSSTVVKKSKSLDSQDVNIDKTQTENARIKKFPKDLILNFIFFIRIVLY